MNTIPNHTVHQMIHAVGEAIIAMRCISALERPQGYSWALGKLEWAHDTLLDAAIAPVAVEPAREPERAIEKAMEVAR